MVEADSRVSNSKNFNISAKPSRVGVLLATSAQSASTRVQHSISSSHPASPLSSQRSAENYWRRHFSPWERTL